MIQEDLSEEVAVWLWPEESGLSQEGHGQQTHRSTTKCVKALNGAKTWMFSKTWKKVSEAAVHCRDREENELSWIWKGREGLDHAGYVALQWDIDMICFKF